MKNLEYKHQVKKQNFNFETIDNPQSIKKEKVKVFEESIEVKFYHIFQSVADSICEEIETGENLKVKNVERFLIESTLKKFNRTNTAKILGLSVRTVRNKIREYERERLS